MIQSAELSLIVNKFIFLITILCLFRYTNEVLQVPVASACRPSTLCWRYLCGPQAQDQTQTQDISLT